jgi:hypothetical protein
VDVVRAFDVVHSHDIDAEPAGFPARLDRPAETDAAGFAFAQPTVFLALGAQRLDPSKNVAIRGIGCAKKRLELFVERSRANGSGNISGKAGKFFSWGHFSFPSFKSSWRDLRRRSS